MLQFTHLLMEAKSKYSPNIKPYLKTHDIIDSVDGFSHIALNYRMLPPVRIKTRPTIFIMKRKTNIKYNPDKARSRVSTKDLPLQMDYTEEEEEEQLNASREMTMEKLVFVESSEDSEKPEEIERNVPEIKLERTVRGNDDTEEEEEEEERRNNLVDDDTASVENVQTANTNKLLSNLRNRKREDLDLQEDSENVPNIDDARSNDEVNSKIEEDKVIKGKLKNNQNLRQEGYSLRNTVKKMIQEKMQEVKQRREIKDERKNTELPIKSMKKQEFVATELPRRIKITKQEPEDTSVSMDESATTKEVVEDEDTELPRKIKITKQKSKETLVPTDEPAMTKEGIKVTREVVKDEDTVRKQKVVKTKNITQKVDKIKAMKADEEQIMKEEDVTVKRENETTDMRIENISKTQDKIDTKSPIIQEKIVEKDDKENVKAPKSMNVRESIRNIINQFKEFERDFTFDDVDKKTSVPDTSDANLIESDVTATDSSAVDYVAENEDQLAVKDPRESLKEIIDQFKYIKHELTSEEDDQFDDIATKYMERPIAETLLQFNEALKSLMQRRRKTSSQATNIHSNKDDHTSEDLLQTKHAKKARIVTNDRDNERAKKF